MKDKIWNYQKDHGDGQEVRSCFCVGPQNGQPVCPCKMRRMKILNGRYVEVIDHGPIKKDAE